MFMMQSIRIIISMHKSSIEQSDYYLFGPGMGLSLYKCSYLFLHKPDISEKNDNQVEDLRGWELCPG